jgi:hypothetical protein
MKVHPLSVHITEEGVILVMIELKDSVSYFYSLP